MLGGFSYVSGYSDESLYDEGLKDWLGWGLILRSCYLVIVLLV